MPIRNESDTYKKGYEAFKFGAKSTFNPYLTKGDRDYFRKEFLDWRNGWEAARGAWHVRVLRFMIEHGIPWIITLGIMVMIPFVVLRATFDSFLQLWVLLTQNTGLLVGILLFGFVISWPAYKLWRPYCLKFKKSLLGEVELPFKEAMDKCQEDIK